MHTPRQIIDNAYNLIMRLAMELHMALGHEGEFHTCAAKSCKDTLWAETSNAHTSLGDLLDEHNEMKKTLRAIREMLQ